MAGNRIKGITIEIDGNTTGLQSSLKDVNGSISKTSTQLRDVNKLLKLDPGNTELVAQKQKLLAEQVNNTKTKLAALESAQKQVNEQFEAGKIDESQYMTFQREVEATKNSLTKLEGGLKNTETYMKDSGDAAGMAEAGYSKAEVQAVALGNASTQLSSKQRTLQTQIDASKRTVQSLEQQLNETKSAYGKNSTEAAQMGAKLNEAKGKVSELEKSMQELDSTNDQVGDGLEEVNKKLDMSNMMEAGDKLASVGDKVVEVGADLAGMSNDYSNSQNKIQASMGGTEASAAKLNDVVKSVFEGGVVESIGDASDAVITVKSSFQDLNNTDLTKLTNSFVQISEKTGTDITDNVNAAKQLMTNFGISGQDALDLIAQGYQNNLNKNGDFLDTLNEYPVQFKAAGYSASEMLAVIDSGMKSGTFNTDKAADAIKEMQVRMGDGTFEGNMKSFSKETQSYFQQWKKGKVTTADVAASIGADLNNMSPAKQQAAISLLGSQFEDLGVKGTMSLLEVSDGYEHAGGKADAFSKKTPGQEFEASIRKLKDAFVPLIQQMTPAVIALSKFVAGLAKMPGPVKVVIAGIGGFLAIMSQLMPIIGAVGATLEGGFLAALAPIAGIVAGVIAAIAAVILVIKNWGSIVGWLKNVWSSISEFFSNLWDGIKQTFTTAISSVSEFIKTSWTAISGFFVTLWDGIKQTFTTTLNAISAFITPTFTAIGNTISTIWNGIKSFFDAIWNGIKTIFTVAVTAIAVIIGTQIEIWKAIITTAMNLIKTVITTVWNALKTFFSTILQAIGKIVSSAWNTIKSVTTKVFNAISSFLQSIWNSIKSVITPIVTAIKSFITDAWNTIKNTTSKIFNAVKSVLTSIWNSIKSVVTTVVNAIKSVISSTWNSIKSVTSNIWNGIKGVISSVWSAIRSGVSSAVNDVKSTVSGVWNGIKSTTRNVWNGIKSAITGPMNAAKSAVAGIINAIKGFFHFSVSWPHIPVPHFGISPSGWNVGDLLHGSIPHLSVNWHAKGAIFNKPTLFATQNGYHGVGEAGAEAVAPLDKLMGYVKQAVAEEIGGITPNVTVNVLADTSRQTVNKIKDAVIDGITQSQNAKRRATGGRPALA